MTSGKIFAADICHVPVLKLVGDIRVLMSSTLESYFSTLYQHQSLDAVLVDLSETRGIDSTALGLLAKMSLQLQKRYNIRPTIVSPNASITRTLQSMNFAAISTIVDGPLTSTGQLGELREI
ncbi:MAG: STAS domain-containing protein [Pseudohongiellaceae bacterium]